MFLSQVFLSQVSLHLAGTLDVAAGGDGQVTPVVEMAPYSVVVSVF